MAPEPTLGITLLTESNNFKFFFNTHLKMVVYNEHKNSQVKRDTGIFNLVSLSAFSVHIKQNTDQMNGLVLAHCPGISAARSGHVSTMLNSSHSSAGQALQKCFTL